MIDEPRKHITLGSDLCKGEGLISQNVRSSYHPRLTVNYETYRDPDASYLSFPTLTYPLNVFLSMCSVPVLVMPMMKSA